MRQKMSEPLFDERKKESVVNRLLARLEKLGVTVTIEPTTVPAVG